LGVVKAPKIENLLELIKTCIEESRYLDTSHADKRQKERKITRPEMLYVLRNGRHEKAKDKFDENYQT